ncbi:MAG: HlyD family secretion protein [Desulfovibrio sp.]|uniref:HlyD family secretion protein n=1 Tax=Desulfovibrio sp. 7SRBS1 TaxID=3378064 RepID=UPI003B40024E
MNDIPAKDINTTPSKKRKMKKKLGLLALVVVVALAAAAIPLYTYAVSHESTDDAFLESHVVAMSPRVDGHVNKVLVQDNQKVTKGQLLVEIDPRDYEADLNIAQAKKRAAEAAVEAARADTSTTKSVLQQRLADLASQKASLAQVKADVTENEAQFTRDATDLQRIKKIEAAGAVSRQELDHAAATEAMSRAKMNSAKRLVDTHMAKILQAKAAVEAAQNTLLQVQAQMEERTADLQRATAEVEQARLNLSYTRITAPCSGHVTKKSVEAGAYVRAGQNMFSIVEDEIWVVANFKETQLSKMRAGQHVDVEVDTYPDVVFSGRVDSIQRGTGSRFTLLPPENAAGNYIKVVQRVPVKIVLETNEAMNKYLLAPGMSVIPTVDLSTANLSTADLSNGENKTLAQMESGS